MELLELTVYANVLRVCRVSAHQLPLTGVCFFSLLPVWALCALFIYGSYVLLKNSEQKGKTKRSAAELSLKKDYW